MPWYFPWSDAIKLRACRYLLQRYLGQFLQHKIDLNQLSVDLYSGKGVVKDVLLDVELINETFEAANLPFEIVDGFIGKVSVEIPWSALLSESTHVEIQGLEVTLKPKQVTEKSVMLNSMWGSMTKSSMQLAEECLKEEERNKRTQTSQFDGLEKFAQAIDIVLTRIKVDFTDIIIRLEQVRDDSKTRAVALEVRIKKLRYFDEAATESNLDNDEVTYNPLPIANKCFYVEGFTIFSDEYSLKPMTASNTTLSQEASVNSLQSSELFYSTTDLGVSESTLDTRNLMFLGPEASSSQSRLNSSTNLVQMAVCHGVTEIRLKVKQSGEASGPKFELEGHVGILHAIVWPKQLEILHCLFGEVFNGKRPESKLKNEMQKPMTDSDYSKIEGELQRDFDVRHHQPRGGNNIQRAMWDNMNASREDEEFYSFTPNALQDSSVPSGVNIEHTISRGHVVTTANSAKFRFKSCFLTLLEDDPKTPSNKSTFQYSELQRRSSAHFTSLSEIESWDLHDTLALRDRFARSIHESHIWLCASSVIAEGVERISLSETALTFRVSIGTLEMWEHLFDLHECPENPAQVDSVYRLKTAPLCLELLTFPNRSAEDRFSFTPCVLIEYEMTENTPPHLLQRQLSAQGKTSLKINLQNARTDVDITCIDRLQKLLGTLENAGRKPGGGDDRWSPAPSSSSSRVPLSFSVLCTNLTASIRFPVLDLRPGIDRMPPWTRSLHKECLVVDFAGFIFKTSVDNELSRRFDFECRNLTAGLQNSPDEKPVVFLRALRDLDAMVEEGRREEFAECPKMSIYTRIFSTNIVRENLYEANVDSEPGSLEALVDSTEKDPSLFTTLRNMVEHEEINCVIPSPPSEAATFKENVISNSQLVIELCIPNVTAYLPDKSLLEILYNRINTDLLLWEPASRRSGTDIIPLSAANLMNKNIGENLSNFEICTNTGLDDSASDSSDAEYDSRHNDFTPSSARRRQNLTFSSSRARFPSEACVILNINKASIGAKVENNNDGKSLPSRTAWVELCRTSIFSVSGYRGQPEIKYSAIKIHQASFHYGDFSEPLGFSSDQIFRRPVHLLPLLTALDEELSVPGADRLVEEQPMLNLAIAIHVDTFRNVKDIKVALELAGIRLHHRVTRPEELWLTQMIDFVNLKDFPVLGYNCPTIITEFHLNIISSAVDYRPVYHPVSALVSVDSVNVSSNIVADSPQSLLRVITQDLRLHLSKSPSPSNLKKDYVCVVDIPFVEFQMKLTDGSNPKFPRFDFRASNNCCYLRTCADSCRELSDLIQYLADYGDLNTESGVAKSQVSNVSAVAPVVVSDENLSEEMMDAMKESPPRRNSIPKSGFTSPVRPPVISANRTNLAATMTKSLMPPDLFDENEIDDDDFCIIEEDLGVGIPLKNGEPSIKFLTPEPIKIMENHFDQPLAATDQLKSPEGYPVPIVRFSLREMSLVWCLYGGKDFDSSPQSSARKLGPQNRLNSAPAKLGESRSNSLKNDKLDHHTKSPSWLRQGGPGRDHSVLMEIHLNKVRFQHEQYPFDGKNIQAARQVLFIQDFDIRDRLAASEINKFLYQYVSNSMPRQSHASMLSIKALHERPDPTQPMQECSLKVSLQPLRLNVDQESLFFLNDFFADVSLSTRPESKDLSNVASSSANGPVDSHPIGRPRRLESLCEEEPLTQSNALIRFDDPTKSFESAEGLTEATMEDPLLSDEPETHIFFKSVTFSPEVPIRLDYHGKYVDMQRVGAFGGLLVGLAQLKCSMLRLKRVHSRQGLRGFDKLILHLLNEWLDDIRKTQLANLLGGVGPMHCLVQLVQGVRDLFWLPVEQYRKDGRIVRGVQRGATAFTTSTLIATIELTNRIVQTVQLAAESAYDVISPGPSFRRKKKMAAAVVPRYSQPGDIREGVVTAYQVLCEGFSDTAREIVDAVSEEHEQKGVSGAVGGALRQIPPAIVKPLILASQATSNLLGGIRNQLQPENRQDEMEKWRTEDDVRNVNSQSGKR